MDTVWLDGMSSFDLRLRIFNQGVRPRLWSICLPNRLHLQLQSIIDQINGIFDHMNRMKESI